jgi:guanine deaminase
MSPTSSPAAAPRRAALHRARLAHVPDDPFVLGGAALRVVADGGLAVDATGAILAAGPFDAVVAAHPRLPVVEHRGAWILPGMVDLHVHFPQTRVIAARGAALLDWLERFVFPEEARFADEAYARAAAELFAAELVRHGTTTALVFGSHAAPAVDACFRAGARRGLRFILGKVLHGEGVPAALLDRPAEARDACRALVADWHGRGKMRYAVTPRFAPTSTPETFALCRELLAATPDLHVTTHVAENVAEGRLVREKFPEARDYVDVYARAGLLGPRTVLAHGVHLSNAERAALAAAGSAVAHCPSSNFFLGSGVFAARATAAAGVGLGLGSDVGAGTSFSLFAEATDAYKASALAGDRLGPAEMLYLATRGGARALRLEREIGAFLPGLRADFVVVDPTRDRLLAERLAVAHDDEDALFALLTLARAGTLAGTYVDGARADDAFTSA